MHCWSLTGAKTKQTYRLLGYNRFSGLGKKFSFLFNVLVKVDQFSKSNAKMASQSSGEQLLVGNSGLKNLFTFNQSYNLQLY